MERDGPSLGEWGPEGGEGGEKKVFGEQKPTYSFKIEGLSYLKTKSHLLLDKEGGEIYTK